MVVLIVRFKSALSERQLFEVAEARAPQYRALKGLRQKYYLKFSEADEYGAVYLWDSESALDEFRESELARTIPTAYQVQGAPRFEVGEVAMALRSGGDGA